MKEKKANPMARIWQISKKEHGRLLLSIVYALFGILAGVLPYVAAAKIISGIISGNNEINYYLLLVGLALTGFALKGVLYSLGLGVSHKAAFSILAETRKEIFSKLPRILWEPSSTPQAGK